MGQPPAVPSEWHDRPGVAEWRRSFADHGKAEREFRDRLAEELLGPRPNEPGQQIVDAVELQGSYPGTELVVIFRAVEWFPGCKLGYRGWVWEDPDDQRFFVVYLDEVINDFVQSRLGQALMEKARSGQCDAADIIWICSAASQRST